MVSMDFKCKGITWVGNMYDKIAVMCSEAEDILTQDTVKYIENQVQNVGGNIKKICAEVMHDLLPPSSENPVKEEDSDIEKNAELGTCKKAKLYAKNGPEKENAPRKILDINTPPVKDSGLVSFLSGVPQINHLLPVVSVSPKKADPDFSLDENVDVGNYKNSKVDTEDSLMEEIPGPQERSKEIGSGWGDSTPAPLPVGIQASDHVSVMKLSQEQKDYAGNCKKSRVYTKADSLKQNTALSDASELINSAGDVLSREPTRGPRNDNHEKDCVTLKNILSQNSFEDKVDNSWKPEGNIGSILLGQSGRDANVPDAPFVSPVVSCENKTTETGVAPSNSILSTERNVINTLTTFKALMESSTESSINEHDQYKDEELAAFMTPPPEFGRSDDDDDDAVELEEADDAVDLGMKKFELFDNVKLEDSCIVVQPFSVSRREGIHRSYKKKIGDAIASRLGSSKKKEYEQLAVWYADFDAEIKQRTESSSPATLTKKLDLKNNSSTDEFNESEWEIL